MKKININFIGEGSGGAGIGSMVSGAFKSVMGIGQLIGGAVQNKKAKALMPDDVDPAQTNMLDVFRSLRKGYQTGSEAASYRDTINEGLSGITKTAAAYSGGNTGSLLATLTGAQGKADSAYNQLAGGLEKNRLAALTMEDQQTDDIAQRKLELQLMRYNQMKTQADSNIKAGQQNWMAGVEEFGGGADSMWGGGAMSGAMGG